MRGKVNKFLFTKIPKIKTLLSKIYFVKHLFNSINYTTISITPPVQNVITQKLLTTQQSPSPPITHYFALQNSQTTSQKSQLFLNS